MPDAWNETVHNLDKFMILYRFSSYVAQTLLTVGSAFIHSVPSQISFSSSRRHQGNTRTYRHQNHVPLIIYSYIVLL